jgi:hypothetical protein
LSPVTSSSSRHRSYTNLDFLARNQVVVVVEGVERDFTSLDTKVASITTAVVIDRKPDIVVSSKSVSNRELNLTGVGGSGNLPGNLDTGLSENGLGGDFRNFPV